MIIDGKDYGDIKQSQIKEEIAFNNRVLPRYIIIKDNKSIDLTVEIKKEPKFNDLFYNQDSNDILFLYLKFKLQIDINSNNLQYDLLINDINMDTENVKSIYKSMDEKYDKELKTFMSSYIKPIIKESKNKIDIKISKFNIQSLTSISRFTINGNISIYDIFDSAIVNDIIRLIYINGQNKFIKIKDNYINDIDINNLIIVDNINTYMILYYYDTNLKVLNPLKLKAENKKIYTEKE